MQSGLRSKRWILQLETGRPIKIEPLMSWTSGDNAARLVRTPVPSRAAAIDSAEALGWRVYVLTDHDRKPVIKSYRDRIVAKPEPMRRGAEKKAVHSNDAPRRSTGRVASQSPSAPAVSLDDILEQTFPASDPLPLWSGRIGPPFDGAGATA